jgi:replication-associated recombination protein RarA
MTPDQYKPTKPSELIGPAAGIASAIMKYIRTIPADARIKQVYFGDYGCGKTCIVAMIARALAAAPIDIESINGKNVSIELVREWQRGAAYSSLFGGWKVKLINETDLIPSAAQELMLAYLDELPPSTAVIATSNASMATLSERFATRFSPIKVDSPSSDEITDFLVRRWKVPRKAAAFIAIGACGNVRDALARASNYLIFGDVIERPVRPAASDLKNKAQLATARRAWAG